MTTLPTGTSTIVEYDSASTFEETLRRLHEVIEAAGLRVFARIDHAAAARDAGLAMPPAALLLYGNAKGGTPIMVAAPWAALELPLRVLVRQGDDRRVRLSFHPIAPILRNVGVPEALATRLDAAQDILRRVVNQ